MNVREYISSGIIEACVLGMASDRDMRELESLCEQHQEIKQALEDYQKTLEDFADRYAKKPPEFLKKKIQDAINNDPTNSSKTTIEKIVKDNNNILSLKYLMAASILFLIGSLVFNFIFWNQTKTFKNEIAALEQKQQISIVHHRNNEATIREYKNTLQLFLTPSVKAIPLSGVGNHVECNAVVLWNETTKQVYLYPQNFPVPPSGKQYQLWAIVDGKPVDAGLYATSGANQLQEMKKIPRAQMFAVTLEKKGGAPSPTLSAMYAAGKI